MAIIISKNGKDARKIEQAKIDLEDDLQQYVFDNPDCLPLEQLNEDTKLLVIDREFQTSSGPIDVLAIDNVGNIYVIETKLYKNPDKRRVIAQMLDYGAALWKSYAGSEEFLGEIDAVLMKSSRVSLNERLNKLYGFDETQVVDVRETIKQRLREGDIRFVVLMDQLTEALRDLILFINQKSRFNIYAVELEFYKHDGMEIVIPRLFGAEVKKEVPSGARGSRSRLASEAEFIDSVGDKSIRLLFQRLLQFGQDIGAEKYLGSSGISVKLPDPKGTKRFITLFVVDKAGEVYIGWTIQQLEALSLPEELGTEYAKSIAALVPGVQPDTKNPDSLSRYLTANEVEKVFPKFTEAVRRFVENLKFASAESRPDSG